MAGKAILSKQGRAATWTAEDLKHALNRLAKGDGLNEVARNSGISKPTLRRHLLNKNKVANGEVMKRGRCSFLPEELENELVKHLLLMESMLFGITRAELMRIAFQFAEMNGLTHRFNKEKESAGKKWYKLFMARHPELSLRQPEATSIARAAGFNRTAVNSFFNKLESLIDKHKFDGTQIYNMDETGLSTVQKTLSKVVGQRGKHQIGSVTSGERGVNTTCVLCMSASGHFVPPMILFKRLRMKEELKDGAPAGSEFACNESGWMDSATFEKWMEHFIRHSKPSPERPVLLILDGHATHTKNLSAILRAKEANVVMLSLPPHTTHNLQPLDVACFKPLQTYFAQELEKWLRNNPGRSITTFQIAYLLGQSYPRAASMQNAVHGFQKCGIWPCNRDVFSDSDFAAPLRPVQAPPSVPRVLFTQQPTAPTLPPVASQQPTASTLPPVASKQPTAPTLPPVASQQPTASTLPPVASKQPTASTLPPVASQQPTAPTLPPVASKQPTTPTLPPVASQQPTASILPPVATSKQPTTPSLPPQPPTQRPTTLSQPLLIKSESDGRCFFRSLVIGMDANLQADQRDTFGALIDPIKRLEEQSKADSLRARVVQNMCANISELSVLTGDILSADMPSSIQFNNIIERISAMSKPESMVGELEIVATVRVLGTPIEVRNADNKVIQKYDNQCNGDRSSKKSIILQYVQLGQDVGHYNCLLEGRTSKHSVYPVPITDISPIPVRKSDNGKTRKRKTECSEILTSSPYKNKLAEIKNRSTESNVSKKAKKCLALKEKRIRKKNVTKQRVTAKGVDKGNTKSWFCFMCEEEIEESMVQCLICERWVHEACTDTTKQDIAKFVCDMC